MNEIEVVIRLPEKTYRKILSNEYDYGDMNVIIQAGTPLPKGHGRLCDLDAALKCIEECEDCEDKTFAIALFDWACSKRVILEADKEADKEEKND